ncbi:15071_t:CDS:2 [Cetraspora pellucida]|uniref:15071_t:CDS:1 n=1 Tax=Cetraspora pellucida TaxID=1433469 RepID=A0A9N9E3B4_9GLOM|nr:15071_t:CDS:2 [Cetraspora pellucida]
MIVKIIQVRQTDKDESNLTIIWTLRVYPVESKDCEVEIVLFVPINKEERDSNVQSVFVKSEYYNVCGKAIPRTYNDRLRLKNIPEEVNDESAMLKLLVNDYAGQNYSFIIKVVFSHYNSRFKHLMNSVRSNESVLFVIIYIEVILNDLYIYAADISYVEVVKKKFSSSSNTQTTSEVYRSVRARLLTAHQNVNEKSVKVSSDEVNKHSADLIGDDFHSSKHVRQEVSEDNDDCVEVEDDQVRNISFDYGYHEQIVEHNKKYIDGSDGHESD